MRRALAVLLLASSCASESQLAIGLMDPDQCETFCVTAFDVTVDGETQRIVCGEDADFGVIAAGRPVPVVIKTVGRGYTLEGRADVDAEPGARIDVDIELIAQNGPRLDSVEPARNVLYGNTPVVLTGTFGDDRGTATVAGEPVEVRSWSATTVEIAANRAGEVVVRSCGVPTPPVTLEATEVRAEVIEPPLTTCAEPRFVAADPATDGTDDLFAVFECGAPACNSADVVRMDGATGDIRHEYLQVPGCPRDITVSDRAPSVLLTHVDDDYSTWTITASASEDLMPQATTDKRFRMVATPAPGRTTLIGVQFRPWTRTNPMVEPVQSFLGELETVADTDGPYFVGRTPNRVGVLVFARGRDVEASYDVRCTEPRILARPSPGLMLSERIVVVCDDVIELFDLVSGRPIGFVDIPREAQRITAGAAVTRDGKITIAYTSAGAIVYANVEEGWATYEMLDAPLQMGPELVRAPRSDTFYLTGLQRGRVLRIAL